MPAKFRIKDYKSNGTYYIYSTAENNRNVFEDEVDFQYFMTLLRRYCGGVIMQADARYKTDRPYRIKRKLQMALAGEVTVWCYCLMRKGIYLVVHQTHKDGVTKLMRRILTGYTMYINKRHRLKGKLFSGVYKGVLIPDNDSAVYLSRWIHLLPKPKSVKRFGIVESVSELDPEDYMYSSYASFSKKETNEWLNTESIMLRFERMSDKRWKSYREFVNDKLVQEDKWLTTVVGQSG